MFSLKNPIIYWSLTIITHLLESIPFVSFSKYSGDKKNGRPDGFGKETLWLFDEHYEGEWVNGKMHGKGRQWFGPKSKSPGQEYKGTFQFDLMHGKGTLTLSDGQVYKGEFFEDKYHGKGECFFPNGDYFKGEYVNNLQHGYGEYTYSNGKIDKGNYVNGNFKG